jgi:Na+/proline symporter
VPVFRVDDERTKVRLARGGVIVFGLLAYVLATRAEGVFELVEQASAFGSAGALVTVTFGLFTTWGGARAAIAALLTGIVTYLGATLAGATAPFLLSLLLSVVAYAVGARLDKLFPGAVANRT